MAACSELAALAEESRVSRQLGFTGKQCIHPSQIDTINAAFTPTSDEITRARAELAAWEAAAAAGFGSTRLGDSMIDAPVVRRARQLLAQAGEIRNP